MNAVMNLNYKGNEVRTVNKNGEVWWVLADVCKILELSNSRETSKRLDDDEKDDVSITDTIGRKQTVTAINESGLYNLIFQSRKPEAKPFRKWVTSEVLPSIRKTGKYEMKQVVSEEAKGKAIRILKLNGMEVVSDPDIMRYTGATRWVVRYYAQKVGERGIFVDGQELVRLKRDNPTLSKYTNQLLVHCLSGAEKILSAMGVPMRLVPVKVPTKPMSYDKHKSEPDHGGIDEALAVFNYLVKNKPDTGRADIKQAYATVLMGIYVDISGKIKNT